MSKFLGGLTVVGVCCLIGLILMLHFFQRVNPGYSGVLIDYGLNTSGQPHFEIKQPGEWIAVGPNQRLIQYPISQQTLTMVRTANEGKVVGDDSITVSDQNGIPMNVEASVFWRVDPEHIGELYLLRPGVPLSGNSNNDIEDLIVRQSARSTVGLVASRYTYDAVLGTSRTDFQKAVKEQLSTDLKNEYIQLDDIQIRNIYLPQAQQDAISAKATAQQAVQTAQLNADKATNDAKATVNAAQGAADAAVAKANGDKQAAILAAQANQQSLQLQGEGQAEQINEIKQALGTNDPNVVNTYLQIQKWNGQQPSTVVGGNAQNQPGVILNTSATSK